MSPVLPCSPHETIGRVARTPVGVARAQPRRRGNLPHGLRRARCGVAGWRLAAPRPRRNPHAAARASANSIYCCPRSPRCRGLRLRAGAPGCRHRTSPSRRRSRRTAWRSIACSSCARICRCGHRSRRCVRVRAKWRSPGCRAQARAPCAACSSRPSRAGHSVCLYRSQRFASEASPAMLRVLLEPTVDRGQTRRAPELAQEPRWQPRAHRSHLG